MKLPKEIPADQVATINKIAKRMATFFERGAPEAFRWLGWAVAIAAVRLAAIKTESWQLEVIPWLLFVLLVGRILWATGLGPTATKEGEPIVLERKWWPAIGSILCWVIAYQIAFVLPAKIVEAGFLPAKTGGQELAESAALGDADPATDLAQKSEAPR